MDPWKYSRIMKRVRSADRVSGWSSATLNHKCARNINQFETNRRRIQAKAKNARAGAQCALPDVRLPVADRDRHHQSGH